MGQQRNVIAIFLAGFLLVTCFYLVTAPQAPAHYPVPRDCPLCDSSVFSYCSDKLLHDACCCSSPYDLPQQCVYADCSFLHANSCREHRLITKCCCNNLVFHYKHVPGFP